MKSLEEIVHKLQVENTQLKTDVKIIRNEHNEMIHTIYNLDKKNQQLQQENSAFKKMMAGERELKGQETNLPRPYIDPNESVMNNTLPNVNVI